MLLGVFTLEVLIKVVAEGGMVSAILPRSFVRARCVARMCWRVNDHGGASRQQCKTARVGSLKLPVLPPHDEP